VDKETPKAVSVGAAQPGLYEGCCIALEVRGICR
jgi:hypothetical protein